MLDSRFFCKQRKLLGVQPEKARRLDAIMSSEPRRWMVFVQLVMPVQCLGSDDIMSLGIESFATEGVGTTDFFRILVSAFSTCAELEATF